MAEFTPDEQKLLESFFTNTERDVFGLKLPQEVAGALFSRYSRSTKSVRRTFLDEFLGSPDLGFKEIVTLQGEGGMAYGEALKKAREFYDRVLTGYGDDSVAQLGGVHIACENISNVAVKVLEDARIGIAPLEKSTRYVRFDKKDSSEGYLFYREPRIMASEYADLYVKTMDLLFETYSSQIDPMIEFVKNNFPVEAMAFTHPQTGDPLTYEEIQQDEAMKRWADGAYRSTVRAHACDILRSYLPAATKTNVGLFGVGQAFEYLLTKLYSHELTELKNLALPLHEEINKLIPSFVKRARFSEYIAETREGMRLLSEELSQSIQVESSSPVTLVDYDREGEEKVVAAMIYPYSEHPLSQVRRIVRGMNTEQRKRIVDEYLRRRRHRRDKPGRALEHLYYTFDFLGNLGIYRDLQRHRILTQERQGFTTAHGYDIPLEIDEIGFRSRFVHCMEQAADLYEKLRRILPREAQYVVPFSYKVRWYMKMNLREAFHIAELRTLPQGHADYRFLVQEMFKKIEQVHPTLSYYARFIDWNSYRLGRLTSEMRTEYKRSRLKEPF